MVNNNFEIIEEMLNLQDSINSVINPNWRDAKNPWYRAIWTECAELMDHIGWKWWKKQEIDIEQAQIELIDIWHFGLSDILQRKITIDEISKELEKVSLDALIDIHHTTIDKSELLTKVEDFMAFTVTHKSFDIQSFMNLSLMLSLDIVEIYKLYVAKNVLNSFRQHNGYKSGEYIKIWNNREDNEHLYEILNNYYEDKIDIQLSSYLYTQLEQRYKQIEK
ncbi:MULTISPECIES: dUTP diphosphatase [Acinetobacter]|jgi:dimeric dUTPase (all-alpha-NTP-PPase superfamily)|uniref:dUTP diphosphatase n=1 Tax=Acinetobacter TaxID=469 RepID=UPI0011E62CE8|nr:MULTISPECIES: dUTP diphosphatase [Acinetobacter]QEK37211.1 hypothetical protein FYN22_15940 [Acinetobacter johnsonii]QKY89399.1 dUTP diphosphatase [Acinetobacter sp. NEB 394]